MKRLFPFLVIALLCPGCFVLDELDSGDAIMDAHRSKDSLVHAEKAKKEAEDKQELDAQGRPVDPRKTKIKQWWASASTPTSRPQDPNDKIVSCNLRGKARFMKEKACIAAGGRI